VVKNGEVLAIAHRGEGEGDHAEYIALERDCLMLLSQGPPFTLR